MIEAQQILTILHHRYNVILSAAYTGIRYYGTTAYRAVIYNII